MQLLVINQQNKTLYLVLNVDTPPRVLPPSELVPLPVHDDCVGPHHSAGQPVPHPHVLGPKFRSWKIIGSYFLLFQLLYNLG